jgi:hypothetical protein
MKRDVIKTYGGMDVRLWLSAFMTSAIREQSASRPDLFIPEKNKPGCLEHVGESPSQPLWMSWRRQESNCSRKDQSA